MFTYFPICLQQILGTISNIMIAFNKLTQFADSAVVVKALMAALCTLYNADKVRNKNKAFAQ